MKLKFKHQSFQRDAARAVTDIFIGQRFSDGFTYTFDQGKQAQGTIHTVLTGYRNEPLMIDNASMVSNIRDIQMHQDLEPINKIVGEQDGLKFTIEMETGTGKTYTYITTMYELNKLYGWSKFVIVVPSIAIREGVLKSLDIMQDHFAEQYGKRLVYFVYNSKNLAPINSFALDPSLQVMVINTQAFNARGADARRFTSRLEDFGFRKPIDVMAATNPILIIDEPQSVLGVDRNNATRTKLKEFKPLFSLLYSATHRKDDLYNQVFRLDAIDALNRRLVKKIEVLGVKQQGTTATNGFVYLEKIIITKGQPQARISHDVRGASGLKKVSKVVGERYDIYQNSDGLTEYKDRYIITNIDGVKGCITLLNGLTVYEGEMIGSVNEDFIRRIQIRETIRTHLERERALFGKGIKVLSLFFIDHVENYRIYESGGTTRNGKYAEMFEEEYVNVMHEMQPTFGDEQYLQYLAKIDRDISRIHQGYFSRDKKGHMVNPKIERGSTDSADVDAYNLIMKDKERLLSFDEPTRFIFSHSALKEGWDNPNVFQICTLKNSDNETKKRQEVGRGMRLCVDRNGERQDEDLLGSAVFDTNILTVIASESYEDFSKALQDELASAISTRPIIVTANLFDGKTIVFASTGEERKLTTRQAGEVFYELVINRYVDREGKLTQQYFDDKKNEQLNFGNYDDAKTSIVAILDKVFNPDALKPQNARQTREAKFDEDKFKKKEFQALWKRINSKSFYTVDFDTAELVQNAIKGIDDYLNVTEIRIIIGTGTLENIRDKEELQSGASMTTGKVKTIRVNEAVGNNVKYDLLGKLVEATGLTRKVIAEILTGIKPEKFYQFRLNPEEFIITVGNIINDAKALAVIKHIEYSKLDDTYGSDIFTESTIRGKLGVNAIESEKSLYDLVVVDSAGTEKPFAEMLEAENDVEVYTKLPRGFYINTPMGHYNPDWAVVFREGTVKHIYFIAETKGKSQHALKSANLRGTEYSKIECARRHFASISDSTVKYDVVTTYADMYNIVTKE